MQSKHFYIFHFSILFSSSSSVSFCFLLLFLYLSLPPPLSSCLPSSVSMSPGNVSLSSCPFTVVNSVCTLQPAWHPSLIIPLILLFSILHFSNHMPRAYCLHSVPVTLFSPLVCVIDHFYMCVSLHNHHYNCLAQWSALQPAWQGAKCKVCQ